MSTEENKALCRRFAEAVSAGNLGAFDDFLTPDFVFHSPSAPRVRTREQYKQYMAAIRAAFPPAQYTLTAMIAEGDVVALRMVLRGVHRGSFRGVAASGKEVECEMIAFARLAGGKIAEYHVVSDMLGLLTQLGAIPPLPQPAAG